MQALFAVKHKTDANLWGIMKAKSGQPWKEKWRGEKKKKYLNDNLTKWKTAISYLAAG